MQNFNLIINYKFKKGKITKEKAMEYNHELMALYMKENFMMTKLEEKEN